MGRDYHWRAEQSWPAGTGLDLVAASFPSPPGSGWLDTTHDGCRIRHQTRPSYAKRADHPVRYLVELGQGGRVVSVTGAVPPFRPVGSNHLAPDVIEVAREEAIREGKREASKRRVIAGAWWNRD